MTCKIDNKNTFENQQANTIQCELCSLWCKANHYRSCAERFKHDKNLLKIIEESNRMAMAQTGNPILPVDGVEPVGTSKSISKGTQDKTGTKQKTRHRRGR